VDSQDSSSSGPFAKRRRPNGLASTVKNALAERSEKDAKDLEQARAKEDERWSHLMAVQERIVEANNNTQQTLKDVANGLHGLSQAVRNIPGPSNDQGTLNNALLATIVKKL
jgi:hypothetical protein